MSVVLEFLASSLFAPIRMLFHTKFVLTNLIGRIVVWRSPPRGEHETSLARGDPLSRPDDALRVRVGWRYLLA